MKPLERPTLDPRRTLAMILAGGVGSRLNVLVQRRAKPAVPFGGIYRLIDFPLSNIMNSGIEKVGILTQYLPYSLTDHIGRGHPWGLVGRTREVRILPPHQGTRESDWYRGTADAIYRNLSYVARHDPELVVVLSGDHIYSMDYSRMIDFHLAHGADATIAVRRIPIETAHLFGIVHADADGRIRGFEEKPERPTANVISMGIYVFSADVLIGRLQEATGRHHACDFGHHIFPAMLASGDRLFAYPDEGYWQDVGTIRAYFDSHMDLLHPEHPLDLRSWRLRANLEENRLGDRPPAYLGPHAQVEQSCFSRGCRVEGTVVESILSPGVVVEEGAVVRRSILMHDVQVGAGCVLDEAILDKKVTLGPGVVIGQGENRPNQANPKHLDTGITVIGKAASVGAAVRIGRNVAIYPGEIIGPPRTRVVESGETIGENEG
jgi:glucose-1-phosphate adenylyltransferase